MAQSNSEQAQLEGQVIKKRRIEKRFGQGRLAEALNVSDRIVREWEAGRVSPSSSHKRDLCAILGIEPGELGLGSSGDYSPEEIDERLNRIKVLLDNREFHSAYRLNGHLVDALRRQYSAGEQHILIPLVQAEYLMGLVTSIASNDPEKALTYFENMEQDASVLKDTSLQSIALTYQGEMLRRIGNYQRAILTIERAPQGPDVTSPVKGNCAQLLARSYASREDWISAEGALKRAEELSFAKGEPKGHIYVCFNPCSVYEEYARLYMKWGKFKESTDFLEKARQHIPTEAPRWDIPILLTRGELLVNQAFREAKNPQAFSSSQMYRDGKNLIRDGAKLAYESGHERQLWRIRRIISTFDYQIAKGSRVSRDLKVILEETEQENRLGEY